MRLRDTIRHHRFACAFILLVLMVHGAFYLHVLRIPDIGPSFDRQYAIIATHIVHDGVYSRGERNALGQLLPTATLPPLFVLIYAASFAVFGFGSSAHEAIHILFVLANLGTVLVSWRIGNVFSRRVSYATAAFAVLDVSALYFTQNYGIPDSLFGFWMALMTLYFVKFFYREPSYRNIFLGAFFLGLGMWTKVAPYMLWAPLTGILLLFFWRVRSIPLARSARLFSVFMFVIMVFFGGWKLRNYQATGYWDFTTVGVTALRWNASHLIAYQEGMTRAEASKEITRRYFTEETRNLDAGARDRYLSRALARLILDSPIAFGYVTLKALPGFFFGTFPPYLFSTNRDAAHALQERMEATHGFRSLLSAAWSDGQHGLALLYIFGKLELLLLYGAVAVAVVAFLRRRELRWVLALFGVIIVYLLLVAGAAAQARYRTMIFPIFYVLGGYGVVHLWDRYRFRRNAAIVPP